MSDVALRALERAARAGDPAAQRRLDVARERTGVFDEAELAAFDARVRRLLARTNGHRPDGKPHRPGDALSLAVVACVVAAALDPRSEGAAPPAFATDRWTHYRDRVTEHEERILVLAARAEGAACGRVEGDWLTIGFARTRLPHGHENLRVSIGSTFPSIAGCFLPPHDDARVMRGRQRELARWVLRSRASGAARTARTTARNAREWARRADEAPVAARPSRAEDFDP